MYLGHSFFGNGSKRVLVMHDWFSDCSSYEVLKSFLNSDEYTFCFVDLRGYGKSRDILGECSVDESVEDLKNLVHHLKWTQFHLIGHSMSGLIAQSFASKYPQMVQSLFLITPVSATGSPVPDDVMSFLSDGARDNNEIAAQIISFMSGGMYSQSFLTQKIRQWHSTSKPDARVAYLQMFSQTNIEDAVRGIEVPTYVVTGEHDGDSYRKDSLEPIFKKLFKNVDIEVCRSAGHYPMIETPVWLASKIESFIEKNQGS